MKTIPKAILDLLHSDAIESAFVPLLDFALPDGTHLRYARYTSDVTYGGSTYTAWPFQAQLLAGGKGHSVPTVELSIDDAVRVLRPYAIATNWFRSCTLTITVVCVTQLAADYAWSSGTYDILQAVPSREVMRHKLGGPNPVKMRFPAERYYADSCSYARGFGTDPRCGYDTTAPGAYTTCTGTLGECVARTNQTRWNGWLGLDPDAASLVLSMALRGTV